MRRNTSSRRWAASSGVNSSGAWPDGTGMARIIAERWRGRKDSCPADRYPGVARPTRERNCVRSHYRRYRQTRRRTGRSANVPSDVRRARATVCVAHARHSRCDWSVVCSSKARATLNSRTSQSIWGASIVSVAPATHGGAGHECAASARWTNLLMFRQSTRALIRPIIGAHVTRGWRSSRAANGGGHGRPTRRARSCRRASVRS